MNIQDLLKNYGVEFLTMFPLSKEQLQVYYAILNCKTHRLGYHTVICNECNDFHFGYNSCRNRHCPMCQNYAKELWIQKQSQYLLDVPYFHIVTTVPSELNPLFLQNKKVMYNILLKATSETILELASSSEYLGATVGITSILHTWGQVMNFHPHVHSIVTGGGLNNNKWVELKKKDFLFPVKVFSTLFKGKFLALLQQANLQFFNDLQYLESKENFNDFLTPLYNKAWVEYIEPPKGNPLNAIEYLGRYSFRVAISNNRIKSVENDLITFEYKDYTDNGTTKLMTIFVFEFLRRFFLHVLPNGFSKIRHYGILQNRNKKTNIKLCRILIGMIICADFLTNLYKNSKRTELKCPVCNGTIFTYTFNYLCRAPPITNINKLLIVAP